MMDLLHVPSDVTEKDVKVLLTCICLTAGYSTRLHKKNSA